MNVSVIIPAYNEESSVEELLHSTVRALAKLGGTYEIIFVDDASKDATALNAQKCAQHYSCIKVINLRKNYGQSTAIDAGLRAATGKVVILMDADLQNDPEDIPMLLRKLGEGYDLVQGWRKERQDNLLRRLPSYFANILASRLLGLNIHDTGCTMKAIRKSIADEMTVYSGMHRFIPYLAHFHGARCTEVIVHHHSRKYGKSKYGLSRTIEVFFDIVTLHFFLSYLTKPMRLFGTVGMLCAAVGVGIGTAAIIMRIAFDADLTDNPLSLFAVLLTVVGVQFFFMGLLGEISSRIYYAGSQHKPYGIRDEQEV